MQVLAMLTAAVLIVTTDQLAKAFVLDHLSRPGTRTGLLELTHNTRGARIALSKRTLVSAWTLLVGLVMLGAATAGSRPAIWLGAGLLLGGATGNLVDRLVRGGVIDFIALGRWPRFNVADVALTVGAGLVLVGLVRW